MISGDGGGVRGGAMRALAMRAERCPAGAVAEDLRGRHQVEVSIHAGDMGEAATPDAWVAATVEAFGGVEVVVNNAGSPPPGRFADQTEEVWLSAWARKPMGYIRLARAAMPHLTSGSGSIVNVIGIAGHQPLPDSIIGGTADPALMNFTKGLADECVRRACTSTRSRRGSSGPSGGTGLPPVPARCLARLRTRQRRGCWRACRCAGRRR